MVRVPLALDTFMFRDSDIRCCSVQALQTIQVGRGDTLDSTHLVMNFEVDSSWSRNVQASGTGT